METLLLLVVLGVLLKQGADARRERGQLRLLLERLAAGTGPIGPTSTAAMGPTTARVAAPAPVSSAPASTPVAPSAPRVRVQPAETALPRPAPAPPADRRGIDLTSGRALAVCGALLVLGGAIYFLTLAITNEWVSQGGQVAIGFAFGLALVAVGLRLRPHTRPPGGSRDVGVDLIASATGLGVVLLSNVVATQVYDVLSPTVGLLIALAAGASAVVLALRDDAQEIAGFGIVVGLAGPLLVGSQPSDPGALPLVGCALVAAMVVAVLRDWRWLPVVAMLTTAPQLMAWSGSDIDGPSNGLVAAVTLAWWAVVFAATIGYELRHAAPVLRTSAAAGTFLAASLVALISFVGLGIGAAPEPSTLLFVLAVLHAAAAGGMLARSLELRVAAIFVAVVGAASLGAAVGLAFDTAVAVIIWSIEACALLVLRYLYRDLRAGAAAAVFGALALGTALWFAPPEALAHGVADTGDAVVALLATGLGALVAAIAATKVRAGSADTVVAAAAGDTRVDDETLAQALRGGAAVWITYAASVLLVIALMGGSLGPVEARDIDQVAQLGLSLFWAVLGLAALVLGLRGDEASRARKFGLGMLALAAVKVLVVDTSQLDQIARVASFIAVGLLMLAGAWTYQRRTD